MRGPNGGSELRKDGERWLVPKTQHMLRTRREEGTGDRGDSVMTEGGGIRIPWSWCNGAQAASPSHEPDAAQMQEAQTGTVKDEIRREKPVFFSAGLPYQKHREELLQADGESTAFRWKCMCIKERAGNVSLCKITENTIFIMLNIFKNTKAQIILYYRV